MTNVDEKFAYPYITKFKKEPFISFVQIKKRDIGNFYIKNYSKLTDFFHFLKKNLLEDPNLTLENVFWYSLLQKYLKEVKKKNRREIFKFIINCEIRQYAHLGFKLSPASLKQPDIYSTYLALSSLNNIGLLEEFFESEGQSHIKEEIKGFILSLRKGSSFLHCHDNECDICNKISPARTLFYVMELFTLLGVDIRNSKDQFRSYIGESKKKSLGLVFKILCLKYLDLESEVREKEIQYLHQLQKENGSFSFDASESINTTFWIVYILNMFSWILDYNPSGIYLFVNFKLGEILNDTKNWDSFQIPIVSKLIILLSLIWNKFINEIERVLFKELEREKFVDLNQLKTTFGLSNEVNNIISYINQNYNFNLRLLDNDIEIKNYIRNLDKRKQEFIYLFYNQLKEKSIISISDLAKKFRTQNLEHLKLKEDIFPVIKDMVSRNFFKGNIRTKKAFLAKTKYYFYLNYRLEQIIVSDTEINIERIFKEKEKLDDIKNDIYNLTLKLKRIGSQIRDEIDSYLLINEIDYAKERLKFIIRSAIMEADFLNENIENSFNEMLYYINIQSVLNTEIAQWIKAYSVLKNNLKEIDSNLKGRIKEKETLRNLNTLLEKLMERLIVIEEDLGKKLDSFKKVFNETLEKEYIEDKFINVIRQLNQITNDIDKYDKIIYNISQQITLKESGILEKHRRAIDNWIKIKEKYEFENKFYQEGFQFFKENLKIIVSINERLKNEILEIGKIIEEKIVRNQFQEAFNLIKEESESLLNEKLNEIKNLQSIVKNEIGKNQKLYLLFKHLQNNLENLGTTIIDLIAKQAQSLKDKVLEERDKTDVHDFDEYVSAEVKKLKKELSYLKNKADLTKGLKIEDITKDFDLLHSNFEKSNKLFSKKLINCRKNIEDFNEKSNLTILQWEKFKEFFSNEISILNDEYINEIISKKINAATIEKKTNSLRLVDLKDELKLSCKVLIKRLKDMIDISKISAELDESEKSILIFTDFYYSNKELTNFIENNILKQNRERVGKILGLYDSSIRNLTLRTNMLEIQNRISDLKDFDKIIPRKFNEKVTELRIDQERSEFLTTKNYLESKLDNDRIAVQKIGENLNLFNSIQSFIEQLYNSLKIELKEYYDRFLKETDENDSFEDIQKAFKLKEREFKEKSVQIQEKIENKIKETFNKVNGSDKLAPEIREFFVRQKIIFLEDFNNKIGKINEQIEIIKKESFRERLVDLINNSKIKLSQLMGNLERKVEDNIETREFKRTNVIIQKRAKSIESEIKEIKRTVNTRIKEYTRHSKNFGQISKFIMGDFDRFINEYIGILYEKVKSLERFILKSYIDMTIKAVANEYLTISFLNSELKIKKKNIQDHLLFLISDGELNGKFDPRFSIYFENADILDELDVTELEVIKNTNFKVNMALHHLKNFASQYGSVIAFFASIITMSYYLFLFSGRNPLVLTIPVLITFLILYYFLRKSKDEKIK